jgi:alcohol dehydrogenase
MPARYWPKAICNAILLPIIENFNRPNAVARFARVAQAMGVDTRGLRYRLC